MKRIRKQNLLLFLIILLAGLGIGYAYLTTTLTINGTTDVDSNTWNVHWDNVQVTTGSISGSQVTQPATITDATTVNFHIKLKEPGEFYEFTVDVKNDGSIDAMIEQIIKTINDSTTIPTYLNYTVTYEDDIPILENQLLAAGTKETYKVRVEYRTDINPGDLPNNNEILNISFATPHIQASGTPINVRTYVYAYNNTRTYIGDDVSKLGTTYDSYEDLYNAITKTYFTRHVVKNGKIVKSELGFEYNVSNNEIPDYRVFYINNTGGAEKFEENKQFITNLFGIDNCEEHSLSNGGYYSCNYNKGNKKTGYFTAVWIYNNDYQISIYGMEVCKQYADGSTRCYYD